MDPVFLAEDGRWATMALFRGLPPFRTPFTGRELNALYKHNHVPQSTLPGFDNRETMGTMVAALFLDAAVIVDTTPHAQLSFRDFIYYPEAQQPILEHLFRATLTAEHSVQTSNVSPVSDVFYAQQLDQAWQARVAKYQLDLDAEVADVYLWQMSHALRRIHAIPIGPERAQAMRMLEPRARPSAWNLRLRHQHIQFLTSRRYHLYNLTGLALDWLSLYAPDEFGTSVTTLMLDRLMDALASLHPLGCLVVHNDVPRRTRVLTAPVYGTLDPSLSNHDTVRDWSAVAELSTPDAFWDELATAGQHPYTLLHTLLLVWLKVWNPYPE